MVAPSNKRFLLESDKAAPNGLATLGADSKVPETQLPARLADGSVATLTGGKVPESQIPARLSDTALAASIVGASTESLAWQAGDDPTGVALSTAAIQTALTAATGKTLYVPKGTYLIDAALTIPANTTLHLDDRATIKLNPGANRNMVTLSAGATLRGGTFDGNSANQTASVGTPAISLSGDDTTVSGVRLLNAKDYGIRGGSNRMKIRSCIVTESGDNAIFIQPSAASITDVLIDGCTVDRSGQGTSVVEGGIKIHQSGAFVVTKARVSNNLVKLPVNTTLSAPVGIEVFHDCDDAAIVGNVVDGGRIGISIAQAKGAAVTGNTCTRNKDFGIEFSGAIRCTASGNTIDAGSIGLTGVSCNSAAVSCTVAGNTVIGCTSSSIKIEGASVNISVAGNVISTTVLYGIEAISSTHLTISGNTVDGNATALKAVMLDKSFPAAISGNTCRRFTQNGVLISSTIVQTVNNIAVVGNVFDSTNGAVATQLSGGATLGASVRSQANMPYADILNVAGDVRQLSGVGSPESAFGGGPGSLYMRTDNGTMYVKNTGTGTTGWKLVTQAA